MIDIERKKQQAINEFYETHCEAPHEIDLLFGFASGYNLGLDERNQLAAQVERLRAACKLGIDMMGANDCDLPKTFETMREALEETPAQALAEIEAAAIERMCNQWQSEAADLPAQHEQPSKGCSTYNWQSHYSRIGLAYASRLRTTNKSGGGDDQ